MRPAISMQKLSFDAPAESPQCLALRRATVAAGLDELALRRLLWLVNANPALRAHARTFANIGALLGSEIFAEEPIAWASAWKNDLADWRAICAWVAREGRALGRTAELAGFDADGGGDANPHLLKGAMRHGITTALWVCHPRGDQDLPSVSTDPVAERYFQLQAHVLAATLECRFRACSLDFYERYTGEQEQPIAPMPSRAVSPALRQLAEPAFDELVGSLPQKCATPEYAAALNRVDALTHKSPELAARATNHLSMMRAFFRRFVRMLDGWTPRPSSRPKPRVRSGYRAFAGVRGMFTPAGGSSHNDPDFPEIRGVPLYLAEKGPGDSRADLRELETSGLAPEEALEAVFLLHRTEDAAREFLAFRRRQLALDMQAQVLPFDNRNLTPDELQTVWQKTTYWLDRFIDDPSRNERNRIGAIAALGTQLMLSFGLQLDDISQLEFAWRLPEQDVALETLEELTLIVQAPTRGDWQGATACWFFVPALSPYYRTELDTRLEEIDRPGATGIVLPDHFGWSARLRGFFSLSPPTSARLIDLEQGVLTRATQKLLEQLSIPRITLAKISYALFGKLVAQNRGDLCLAWLLTYSRARTADPRLFYSRYGCARLSTAYGRAAHSLARDAGLRYVAGTVPAALTPADSEAGIGARFVLSQPALASLVAALEANLTDRYVDRDDPYVLMRYHNRFMLHTVLLQGMATGMRAVRSPDTFYLQWLARGQPLDGFDAGLADKSTDQDENARYVRIGPELCRQFGFLRYHMAHLATLPRFYLEAPSALRQFGPMHLLANSAMFVPVTPSALQQLILQITDYPIPANAHRAYLRTELVARDCPAEVIDAFLGHGSAGERAFGEFSSFHYPDHRAVIEPLLSAIRADVGLRAIESRLIPFSQRRPKRG